MIKNSGFQGSPISSQSALPDTGRKVPGAEIKRSSPVNAFKSPNPIIIRTGNHGGSFTGSPPNLYVKYPPVICPICGNYAVEEAAGFSVFYRCQSCLWQHFKWVSEVEK